ncbi:hypothetical protein [Agarilytica rhodophyticola]|uniref:hypothetical protein n=1 Tax=Agarilytica rhodophyticola TaxID=1737490 RepID=UPI000B34490E|nr:hypothetical protein [Agarilytica rhodophyticola]
MSNSKEKIQDIEKHIDQSLEDSSKAIDSLKTRIASESAKLPKQTLVIEDRLSSIQDEMSKLSDKMLAYKLRRIADSKMLESVSKMLKEERQTPAIQEPAIGDREPPAKTDAKQPPDYSSTTFKCKSDLDKCLLGSSSALERALCYALFIRCAMKG